MPKFEQPLENRNEKPAEVHLATINQTLTAEELDDFINQLPERMEDMKAQIKKAEEVVSKGGFKIGKIVIGTPGVENAELQLPILKQHLETLESAQKEALEKKGELGE